MELLDRYLLGVKRYLPWERQQDILAELRANLESQLEDKEAGLGRPLNATEAEAWVRQLGSPMQMAARYQRQQYLIGPGIFPVYWYVLQMAVFWSAVAYTGVSVVLSVLNYAGVAAMAPSLMRIPAVLMTTAAWVTLVFAALEYVGLRYPESLTHLKGWPLHWNPGDLPRLENAERSGKCVQSYTRAVAEVIFGLLFLIWLLIMPRYPVLWLGAAAYSPMMERFIFAAVVIRFYWLLIVLYAVQLAWRVSDLGSGRWQRPGAWQRIVFKALGLLPIAVLASAPHHVLVLLRHPLFDQQRYGVTIDAINQWSHVGLVAACAIVAAQLVWEIVRPVFKAYQDRATV